MFSALHTSVTGHGPADEVVARRELIRLAGDVEIPTDMYLLDSPVWTGRFTDAGLIVDEVLTLDYEGEAPSRSECSAAAGRRGLTGRRENGQRRSAPTADVMVPRPLQGGTGHSGPVSTAASFD